MFKDFGLGSVIMASGIAMFEVVSFGLCDARPQAVIAESISGAELDRGHAPKTFSVYLSDLAFKAGDGKQTRVIIVEKDALHPFPPENQEFEAIEQHASYAG